MPIAELNYAKSALKNGLGSVLMDLVKVDAAKAKLTPTEYSKLRQSVIQRVGQVDGQVQRAIDAYRASAAAAAAQAEAKHAASIPYSAKNERRREQRWLRNSHQNPADLLQKAAELLAAGQAELAEDYLLASRIPSQSGKVDPVGTGIQAYKLEAQIAAAVAETHPDLKRAAAIRNDLDLDMRQLNAARYQALAVVGLGVDRDGLLAPAGGGEAWSYASIMGKLAGIKVDPDTGAFLNAQTGEPYSEESEIGVPLHPARSSFGDGPVASSSFDPGHSLMPGERMAEGE